MILFLKIGELDSPQAPRVPFSCKDSPRTAAVTLLSVWTSRNLRKTCFFAYFWQSSIIHKCHFLTGKYSIHPRISIAHSVRLELSFLFLFLKVKSDHFTRFYGNFSDFSPVACGDTLKSSCWTWNIEFWQENIGIELLKTKTTWKLVKFVIQPNLFELHPSIFEDSMAISSFWHVLVILQTSEKSLKWP